MIKFFLTLSFLFSLNSEASFVFRWSYFKSFETLTKQEFKVHLQTFINDVEGTGFRYVGDYNDFDHCHLLYGKKSRYSFSKGKLKGMLCHTQEHSYKYNKEDAGGKYDYLDRNARNWIYYFDSKKSFNANSYRVDYTTSEWEVFDEHNTINSSMLSNEKLGFYLKKEEGIHFKKVSCQKYKDNSINNIIEVFSLNLGRVCLNITTTQCNSMPFSCNKGRIK